MRIIEKDKIKPLILILILMTVLEIITICCISNLQYKRFERITNSKVSQILGKITLEYGELPETEIINILNSEINTDEQLSKYGIDVENEFVIQNAQKLKNQFITTDICILIVFQSVMLTIFIIYLKYKERKIDTITQYLKEINNKNYTINLDNMTEDELSKLENELYKITVMLKEEAENSKNEKVKLAHSIEDISHQLKTPLTSISIMLDNLNNDKNMEPQIKQDFLREITKQVEWMKWLVISLLKFSKIDAGATKFKCEKIKVEKLFSKVLENMSIPIEIKNVKLSKKGDLDCCFTGDFNWEVEAYTNIIKNCIEHTVENKEISIMYEENNLYTKIIISDEGNGISESDLPHIFERFYKGKNSSNDSYGIGLALAKSVIEKDKGRIVCRSELNKGTTFEIQYQK